VTPPLWALLGYVVWTMLLVTAILGARGVAVLHGEKKVNEFPGGVQHGGDLYWRLNRAHVNTAENLPIVAILVLVGTLVHTSSRAWNVLPLVALGARVLQSIAHVSSGSVMAVNVRFTGFVVQYLCFAWMLVEIARGAAIW
jgi:uncharacterized MAPEG superfamily protein